MKIFHGTENANIHRPTVLTLGVFDGLHLGHQRIMQTVVERGKAANDVPTVLTFDPHPRSVQHRESAPPLLQTLDQRLAALEVLGIEQTILIRFNREFAAIDAETFLRDVARYPRIIYVRDLSITSLNNQESVNLTLVTYDAPTSGILPPIPTELRAEFQTHAGQLPN